MMNLVRTIIALWAMSRPLIMLSVILVYIEGLLIARYYAHVLSGEKIFWGLAALLLVAASIHYANEYADVETDALTTPTLYSGGSGVLPQGKLPRLLALQVAWLSLILGSMLTILGYWLGVLSLVSVACLGIGGFFGWMYSLPPLKLAWHGWGELINALLGGLLLPLYAYTVLSGEIRSEILLICLPFTLLTFNNLLATTWSDKLADAQVGKNTLATKLAVRQLRRLYLIVAVASFGFLFLLSEKVIPNSVVYASFLALPMVIWGGATYTRIHPPYPSSNAMVVLLLAQILAWYLLV